MEQRRLTAGGGERSYWVAEPFRPAAPLLVVLHGSGLDGPRMAAWTGLAERGPAAGFNTVFPDAVQRMWDDTGRGRRDGLDDDAFVSALVEELAGERLLLAGLSNGASFAEHLARHGQVAASAVALVSGSARAASREASPRPVRPAALLAIAGTRDRISPYAGGPARGLMGSLARRRSRSMLAAAEGREVVPIENVAADWAAANGCPPGPLVERGLKGGADRLTWGGDGRPPVVLYRVVGGGHGWPGGPQYAPRFLVGEVRSTLDATQVALDFFKATTAPAGG